MNTYKLISTVEIYSVNDVQALKDALQKVLDTYVYCYDGKFKVLESKEVEL